MSKFILSILIIGGFLFTLFSNAQTNTPDFQAIIKQLQGQIKLLNQQILDLQFRLEKTEEEVQVVKAELKLTKALRKGESNDEVRQLQEFLKQFPDIYPEGIVTGFFGSLTETAVKRFQEKHGIESIGIVGPKTIQKLNEFSVIGTPAIPAIPAVPGISPAIPAIPASPSLPFQSASSSQPIAIPAVPATPAIPAVPGVSSATPAVPAIPAQPSSSTSTPTPTVTVSVSPSPTASPSYSPSPTPTSTPTPTVSVSPTPTPIPSPTPTPTPTQTSACTDSDGGFNFYTKGTGRGIYAGSTIGGLIYGEDPNKSSLRIDPSLGAESIYYDHCHDSSTYNQVDEAYCDSSGKLHAYGYNCSYGCSNGVCNSAPTPTPTPAPTSSISFSPLDSYQISAMANILNALKSILQTLNNLLSR